MAADPGRPTLSGSATTSPQPPASSPQRWYRSLYWRIAIGFVMTLAAMLVVQAMLFVWVVSRSGPTLPGQPERFAQTVAVDIADELRADPSIDLAAYIDDQYARDAHPFFVLLADGRVFGNFPPPYPEPLLRGARNRLQRGLAPDRERFRRGGPGGRGRGFGPGGMEGPPPPPPPPQPILVGDELAGVVVVLPRAPFWFMLRRYAPTLSFVAAAALAAGAIIAAVLIFGPARRRLRAVEDAARRLGAGDLSARAPARGGDEVAAVASAFNAMADDLAARADALAAADRARRQLLADVSHELTTPVTAMRGYLETLTMPEFALDDATRARYLAIVGDETARLERLIGDLLDLAKLEGGGGAFVVEDVPLAELFARVTARHEREAADAGVTIASGIEAGAETYPGRPRPPRAGPPEPRRQRASLRAAGFINRAARAPDARRNRDHSGRPRRGHPGRTPSSRLRSLLQGRRGPDADRRQRPGALDCQGDRRTARWNDQRQESAGEDGLRSNPEI